MCYYQVMETIRKCNCCGLEKSVTEFYKLSGKEGYRSHCKECFSSRSKRYNSLDTTKEKRRIIDSRYRESNRERVNESSRRYRASHKAERNLREAERRRQNREKTKAHNAVHYELEMGRLVKGVCEVCGCVKVEAHHDDYDKPLEVRWLCKEHHEKLHHGTLEIQ